MKRLKKHWIMGPMSWLLSAALVLPAWLAVGIVLLAAPRAAHAQTLNRSPLWAVVDFSNTSGYGGNEIGVQASDGFVVELSKTNKYDVASRSDTEQAIANDGLVVPLDSVGLQKLSRDLNADAVATGTVRSVAFSDNPRRATVSVVIEVVDRISGELINGAVAQGTSTPRPIPDNDDDALVNQAVENADFDAVKQISNYSLPRATVLIHEDPQTVTLNKGSEDGYSLGLNLLVTRNNTEVGRIQVSQLSADECYARVVEQGLGIQPQDVCTAIYQLPPYSIGPDHRLRVGAVQTAPPTNDDYLPHNASRNLFTGSGGLLVALGAAVGIVALATSGHAGTSSGTNAIGGGRTGGVDAALDQTNLGSFSPEAGTQAADNSTFVPLNVDITFNPGQLGGNPGTIEYHIYRNPQPPGLAAGTFTTITTGTGTGTGTGTTTGTTIADQTLDQIGLIPIISPASPSGGVDNAGGIFSLTVQKPALDDDQVLEAAELTGDTTTATPIPGTGLTVGERVNYSVEGLYAVPNLVTGTSPGGTTVGIGTSTVGSTSSGTTTSTTTTTSDTGLLYSLSELVFSNYVTYLQPVILRSTNRQTGGTVTVNGITTTLPPYPFPAGSVDSTTPTTDSYYASSNSSTTDNVIVTVDSVYGGTATVLDYALEFSTDPNFGNNIAHFSTTFANGSAELFREGTPFAFGAVNLRTISQFQNASAIYVRVGVRDLRNGSDDSTNPYLWSTADPNQSIGGTLPTYLLPNNQNIPTGTAVRSASALLAGTAVLTPKFTFIPHRASVATGAASPAIQVSAIHPWMTPSQTPHLNVGTLAHPTVGNTSGSARPTKH